MPLRASATVSAKRCFDANTSPNSRVHRSLKGRVPTGRLRAMENAAAARAADVVVLTIPFAHHETTLVRLADALQGKILVDATVPLVPPKVSRVQLPPEVEGLPPASSSRDN